MVAKSSNSGCTAVFGLLFIALVFVLMVISSVIYYANVESTTITITHKERIVRGSGDSVSSYYLVYTDRETFALKDDLFYGQFNSSDIYGRIKSGDTYRVTALGVRVPFLSWYRNLVSVEAE